MQHLRPMGQPGRPDEEPTLIRAELGAVIAALPPRRVLLAHGAAPPPERATISASPRIVLVLDGINEMDLPHGGQVVTEVLTAGDWVVVTERSWNRPRHRHAMRFMTLDFKRHLTRYYCREHLAAGLHTGGACIHLRLEPPAPAIQHAWHAIEALAEQGVEDAIPDLATAVVREATRTIHRPPPTTAQGQATWRALCDLIDDRLGDPDFGREALAQRCGLHPNHVSRLFRQQAGERFGDYLSRQRLERAASMLRSFELPVKAVAASCGYRDQAYFANAFKRRYGCSPSAWRRSGLASGPGGGA